MNFWQCVKNFFVPCVENKFKPACFFSSFMYWVCFVLLLLHVFPIFFFSYFNRDPLFADITRTAIVQLTNNERNSLGINTLKHNALLDKAAMLKAQDMFKNQYFAHNSPSGITPWFWFDQVGYPYEYAGENLAIGFLEPEEVYNGWVNSFTHHQNLLGPNYDEIGVAVLTGDFNGSRTTIVVQLFGSTGNLVSVNKKIKSIPVKEKAPITEPQVASSQTQSQEVALKVASEPVEIKKETNVSSEPTIVEKTELNESKEMIVVSQVAGSKEIALTEPLEYLSSDQTIKKIDETFRHKFLNFLVFNYNDVLRYLTYYVLIFLLSVLIMGLSFSQELRRPQVVFELIFFLAVLIIFTMADKKTLIELIPHSFMIS